MSQRTTNFPTTAWDGDSASRLNAPAPDRAPNAEDYNQAVSEMNKVQSHLIYGAVANPPVAAGSNVITSTLQVGGSMFLRKTRVTVPATDIATVDDATHGAFGGLKLFDFPEGLIKVEGAIASIALAAGVGGITDTAAVVGGVGTSTAAQSSGDGTLAAAEANIIGSTALTLAAGVKAATKLVGSADLFADGTAAAKSAYLNFQVPTAGSSASDTLTVSGWVDVYWMYMGDAP